MNAEDTDTPEPTDDESLARLRSELEAEKERIAALERENAALLAATAGGAGAGVAKPKGRRSHRFWVAILLVIGSVLTPLTIVALFVKNTISDTDRYVQTVKPLSSNPAIQAYVAQEVSQELFQRVDIKKYVKEALPTRADVLAGPLTSALQGFVLQAVERILATDQFQTIWIEANRIAHNQLVNVLTGQTTGGITATQNGAVTVDLSDVTKLVQQQLESTGIDLFSKIPIANIGGKITVFQSNDLYKVRTGFRILNTLAFVMPFLVFGCFGGAIFLSKSRRRGFVDSAIAFTFGALILGFALFIGRGAYLNAATGNNLPYDAAAAMYDTLVRFLITSVRAATFFSLIVVIAVFFAGPSRFAVWFRMRVRQGANWLGAQSDQADWKWLAPNAFVVRRKKGLRIVVGVVAFLVLFRWQHPTPSIILYFALVAVFLLGVIEFFGREPIPDDPARRPAGLTAGATPSVASG
ncbi:MAG: hypothetical protein ACXVKN_09005 [Acidimicrobiia bacterium]